MEEAIVLYPTPAISHLISMVELGKLIVSYNSSTSIHILILEAPYNAGSTSSYIATVSATFPSIKFHRLPTIVLPSTDTKHYESLTFEVIRLSNHNVHNTLLSISKTYAINAFIMDFFCAHSLSVATELNIPGYFFFTTGVSFLATFLNFPSIHQNTTKSFKDLNTNIDVPGVPSFPASYMPLPMLDRNDKAYDFFLDSSKCFPKSAGIIVNSFELLEPKAIKAILDGLCIPDSTTPPLSCIGPLIATSNAANEIVPDCLTWLDSQPSKSVIFLCFGSLGLFSKEQLSEIAIGLEKSGRRFLWVFRNPPSNHQKLAISAQSDPDLKSLLPDGFLARTKQRGLVVKLWVPQVAVLNHDSVGGFVTHCGWNSVLEAVCAGVPLITWPLYAEQKFNRVLLVEEIKIALPINWSENQFVTALEVEKRVSELMESESGNSVRERVIALKEAAAEALTEGGSSLIALSKLTDSWRRE
ncbi:UDP-glycosyltransferase 88A1 isoform X1 [Mercurialis annua]|uniref:UDP-glycosyltransferase 88A1 isoform X1 n=1 Tax=Mercurialis annua TaxID=3986 RepID=UPI0024ADCAF9|nr:UDP-glycosyltransferase 88A1 isoform X1 [Mercurialis annua]XP_055961295.1 UDP-glycosyltransferase 88A1 isoform X1 [Mercurialis annua]